MDTKHKFDFVQDAQEIFRLLLDGMANPGKIELAGAYTSRFTADGEWLSLSVALLDGEVSYWSNLSRGVKDEIHFLTGTGETGRGEADFLLIDGNEEPEAVLSQVRAGTYTEPEKSALLIVREYEKPSVSVTLRGPGVPPGGRQIILGKRECGWLQAREKMGFEYPCGVDFLFLRPGGSFFAVTRKVEVKEWHM